MHDRDGGPRLVEGSRDCLGLVGVCCEVGDESDESDDGDVAFARLCGVGVVEFRVSGLIHPRSS